MRKRKNTNSRRSFKAADGAIIVLCLAGAFLSFWFFWEDLNQTINRHAEAVGSISFKQGSAQRRFADRVLWDRLRKESPVYEGDFIHTSELSDATVTFLEGQKIGLSENSLVRIRTVKGRTVVDLTSGNISVENSGASALVLVSGNREVELAGLMKVRASEDGDFDLEVLKGTAIIRSGEDVIVQDAGQVLSVSSGGAAVRKPRVIMVSPLPDESFTISGETLSVAFSWIPAGFTGTEYTRLEIAEDRRFAHTLQSLDVNAESAEVSLPPHTGGGLTPRGIFLQSRNAPRRKN
jgi:hypothetical protein